MNRLGARQRALDYLQSWHVATLSTTAAGGPWAAAVFYVNDGFTLYFLSSPRSRHSRNLEADPRAAAAIQGDYRDWREIKGVQLEGRVTALEGEEERRARQLYTTKFPIAGEMGGAPAAIAKALARIRWYKLTPLRVFFIDNSVSFGHREEISI